MISNKCIYWLFDNSCNLISMTRCHIIKYITIGKGDAAYSCNRQIWASVLAHIFHKKLLEVLFNNIQ